MADIYILFHSSLCFWPALILNNSDYTFSCGEKRKKKKRNTTPSHCAKVLRRLVDKFPQCDVSVILLLHRPFSPSSLPHGCITSVHNQALNRRSRNLSFTLPYLHILCSCQVAACECQPLFSTSISQRLGFSVPMGETYLPQTAEEICIQIYM